MVPTKKVAVRPFFSVWQKSNRIRWNISRFRTTLLNLNLVPMHLQTIQNDFLKVGIAETGAEIRSLRNRSDQREWMWQADPQIWPRTAPVLFPMVGKLSDNQYYHQGVAYPLSQHGFARDRVFDIREASSTHLLFHLGSDYESRKFFPFAFELFIRYTLAGPWVWVDYTIENPDTRQTLAFSIGAHPGFALPGFPAEPYSIVFEKEESLRPIPLENGLLTREKGPIIDMEKKRLALSPQTFHADALVLEGLKSTWVGVARGQEDPMLKLHMEGFPFFGIWSKPDAPFVCLEPWHGHADRVGPPNEWFEKESLVFLPPGDDFHCRYSIEICQS